MGPPSQMCVIRICGSVTLPHTLLTGCCRGVFSCLNSESCSTLQVFLKDNASLLKDCNVTMEIPAHTTIAFALTELEIRHDGHFGESYKIRVFYFGKNSLFMRHASPSAELCLMSDTKGGFEVDGPPQTRVVGVTGAPANNHLRQGKGLFGTFLPRCLLEGIRFSSSSLLFFR